jgi:hypothetical protein
MTSAAVEALGFACVFGIWNPPANIAYIILYIVKISNITSSSA